MGIVAGRIEREWVEERGDGKEERGVLVGREGGGEESGKGKLRW